jgi:hypothetical protein
MAQMKKSGPAKPAYKTGKPASKKMTPGNVGKAVGKAVIAPVVTAAKLATLPTRTATKIAKNISKPKRAVKRTGGTGRMGIK